MVWRGLQLWQGCCWSIDQPVMTRPPWDVCFHVSPQNTCLRGCIVTLVAFFWLFSTVSPRIAADRLTSLSWPGRVEIRDGHAANSPMRIGIYARIWALSASFCISRIRMVIPSWDVRFMCLLKVLVWEVFLHCFLKGCCWSIDQLVMTRPHWDVRFHVSPRRCMSEKMYCNNGFAFAFVWLFSTMSTADRLTSL